MGVKSTVHLTREEAERRYIEMKLEEKEAKWKAKAKIKLATMSNEELENVLEEMNDAKYPDYGGYDNYAIGEFFG